MYDNVMYIYVMYSKIIKKDQYVHDPVIDSSYQAPLLVLADAIPSGASWAGSSSVCALDASLTRPDQACKRLDSDRLERSGSGWPMRARYTSAGLVPFQVSGSRRIAGE
jgi:hypothetical protein